MKTQFKIISIFILLFVIQSNYAQNEDLKIGDKIKHFSALDDEGNMWNSKNIIGKKNLVVYFYPAAMTGGCTKQACAYRDSKDEFSSVDAEIIGISGDKVQNLELFKRAHNLNFTLLSDENAEIAGIFGVPVREGERSIEREVEGETFTLSRAVTTSRWTFIIDKNGKLVYKSTQVDAAEDSNNVLMVLQDL